MPYIIKSVSGGFKVAKRDNPKITFSSKPLTKKTAIAQRTAIILSEIRNRNSRK